MVEPLNVQSALLNTVNPLDRFRAFWGWYNFSCLSFVERMSSSNCILTIIWYIDRVLPSSPIQGWENLTDAVIHWLNEKQTNIVFLLWGSYAQKKGSFIDKKKHCVLASPHPSPLSAHRGFFGNKHFSKTNDYLQSVGKTPIDWNNLPRHVEDFKYSMFP